MVSTVLLSEVFLIVILPLSGSTSSSNVKTILLFVATPVALSAGLEDDKVGLGVGITEKLTKSYDAVKFAKIGSEIIGGIGGGGRKDFAQAGGQDANKIDEAIQKLKSLI